MPDSCSSSAPAPALYFKLYDQIYVRSLAAKLAGAETVIKGVHSIKKNPITFFIRDIKFTSEVGRDSLCGKRCRKEGTRQDAKRLLCSINTDLGASPTGRLSELQVVPSKLG